MGTKKKPQVKKSKSKSKKHSVAKHVERTNGQEVPDCETPTPEQNIDQSFEAEANSDEDAVLPAAETETVGEELVQIASAESGDDQQVPSSEERPVGAKLINPLVCHQRIEELKQGECGGGNRSAARRKLSLQVKLEASKQETRRLSLADLKQIKHPLQDSWGFWYYMGNKFKQWNENLRQVCKITTVEDFWCLHNDLICPSQLSPGKDFSFFKRPIRPEWEDPANRNGGMWSFCPREKNNKTSDMDRVWLEMLMFLIGDQFDILSQYVNGVTYSKRKTQDRISLWIGTDITKTDEILKIGQAMKRAIGNATTCFKLEYSTSDDWKQKTGSSVLIRHSLFSSIV